MKYKLDRKYLYWGLTAFLVVVASLCFYASLFKLNFLRSVLHTFFKILNPILYGFVITYLLLPVMIFFEKHLLAWFRPRFKKQGAARKLAQALSICITMILACLFLAALISMIIPQLIASIIGIAESLPAYYQNLLHWMHEALENNPEMKTLAISISETLYKNINAWYSNDLLPQINNMLTQVNSMLAGITTGVVWILVAIKDILVGFILSIYILLSKDLFAAQSKKTLYALCKTNRANAILSSVRYSHKVFGGFIIGKIVESIIVGVLCFIGMVILKLPFPLLISVIIGVTNVVPFFGPIIGAIPCVFLILLVSPLQSLYFLIFIIVLQQIDMNIIAPKILGSATGLAGFWVICSVLVFGGLFGLWGMILGVPVFAVVYTMGKAWIGRILQRKGLPVDTASYKDLDLIDEESGSLIPIEKK